ncbi:MAG: sigma-70 family RNA polymerase sigma factor [Gemmataceae bacterium]
MAHHPLRPILAHLHKLAGGKRAEACTDAELLEHFAREQHEDSFTELVRRYGRLVMHVCRSVLTETQDVEDVFQATFLALARKAGSIRKGRAVGSWLYGVAYRLALKENERQSKRRRHERRAAMTANASGADDDALQSIDEVRPALFAELDGLPEKYRAPLVLCYLQGKSNEEAARQLQWPIGTIKGRMNRARDLLRDRLARRGVALSTGAIGTALASGSAEASVNEGLVAATVREAIAFAAGQATASTAPLLALGVLARSRLRLALVVLILIGAAGGIGLVWSHRTDSTDNELASPGPIVPRSRQDGLPPGALAHLGSLHLRHLDAVTGLAFAGDGKSLASVGQDRRLRAWDVDTGAEAKLSPAINNLRLAADGPGLLAPGGRLLVALSPAGTTLQILDVTTGTVVRERPLTSGRIIHPCFAADGRALAFVHAADGFKPKIVVWKLDEADVVSEWDAPADPTTALAVGPRGARVACAGLDQPLQILEGSTGRRVAVTTGNQEQLTTLAFRPDGRELSALRRNGGEVLRFDAETGTALESLPTDRAQLRSLTYAPDGKAIALGAGLNPLDRAATADLDAPAVEVWDLAPVQRRWQRPGHRGAVRALAWSADGGTLASGGVDRIIRMWDATTGEESAVSKERPDQVIACAYSPDGRTLMLVSESLAVWDLRAGKEVRRVGLGTPPLGAVAFAPDGTALASADVDRRLRLRSTQTGEVMWESTIVQGPFTSVAFSADGTTLATSEQGHRNSRTNSIVAGPLRLWSSITGKEAGRLIGHPRDLSSFAFAPDGHALATLCPRDRLCFYQLDGNRAARPQEWGMPVGDEWLAGIIAFAPDGARLATTQVNGQGESTIVLWDMSDRKKMEHLARMPGAVTAMAWSPDGKTLATASDDLTIRVWDVGTGRELRRLRGHSDRIPSLAYAPDGATLASLALDHSVLIWDMTAP